MNSKFKLLMYILAYSIFFTIGVKSAVNHNVIDTKNVNDFVTKFEMKEKNVNFNVSELGQKEFTFSEPSIVLSEIVIYGKKLKKQLSVNNKTMTSKVYNYQRFCIETLPLKIIEIEKIEYPQKILNFNL